MGQDIKKSPAPARTPANASPGDVARNSHASGRVAFDARGDAQWQWHMAEGDTRPEASTTRVQKLQSTELTLEPTMKVQAVEPPQPTTELPCGGFNPYDRGAIAERRQSVPVVPKTKYPPIVKPPADDRLSARVLRWLKSGRS